MNYITCDLLYIKCSMEIVNRISFFQYELEMSVVYALLKN